VFARIMYARNAGAERLPQRRLDRVLEGVQAE
jgi:hypothetical protein